MKDVKMKILGSRRSQAAMEFLMTYGWAILVVLAAITALAYFGVLSPSKFLPESCTIQPTAGMSCLDFRMDPDAVNILMMNSGGRDLIINNMSVGSCFSAFDIGFPDGTSRLFTLSGCSFGVSGAKNKEDILISYTDTMSQFTKSAAGTITARIA